MGASARFLIIDGYHKAGRDELAAGGASAAGDLYSRMLQKCLPGAACDIVNPADPGASLPKGAALEQYDGIAWTGCSLTIYDDDPRVGPQIELARAAYESKVPSFGGGVRVAALPTSSGQSEILTAGGAGSTPDVRSFDASGQQLDDFYAYDSALQGGLYVAAG